MNPIFVSEQSKNDNINKNYEINTIEIVVRTKIPSSFPQSLQAIPLYYIDGGLNRLHNLPNLLHSNHLFCCNTNTKHAVK